MLAEGHFWPTVSNQKKALTSARQASGPGNADARVSCGQLGARRFKVHWATKKSQIAVATRLSASTPANPKQSTREYEEALRPRRRTRACPASASVRVLSPLRPRARSKSRPWPTSRPPPAAPVFAGATGFDSLEQCALSAGAARKEVTELGHPLHRGPLAARPLRLPVLMKTLPDAREDQGAPSDRRRGEQPSGSASLDPRAAAPHGGGREPSSDQTFWTGASGWPPRRGARIRTTFTFPPRRSPTGPTAALPLTFNRPRTPAP